MIFWPHIGIAGGFEPCDKNILAALNRNSLLIDSILQMKAIDFVSTLPENPEAGDIYILENDSYGYGPTPSPIYIYSGQHWIEIEPKLGFIAAVESENALFWFNGSEWALLPMGTGDVSGPFATLKNSIARWSSEDGKWITDSGVILEDDNSVTGVSDLYSGQVITENTITETLSGEQSVIVEDPPGTANLTSLFGVIEDPIEEITSFTSPTNRAGLYLIENASGLPIVIKNNSEISTGTGDDFTLQPGATAIISYSPASGMYGIVGGAGSGTSGIGGSLKWLATPGSEPLKVNEFGLEPYIFASGQPQEINSGFRVSLDHPVGKQMFLDVSAYTKVNTSDNSTIRLTSTLIKLGQPLSSTANQRVTDTILSATIANAVDGLFMSITDDEGMINGLEVAPEDTILMKLQRVNSTSNEYAGDVYLPAELIKVVFA